MKDGEGGGDEEADGNNCGLVITNFHSFLFPAETLRQF